MNRGQTAEAYKIIPQSIIENTSVGKRIAHMEKFVAFRLSVERILQSKFSDADKLAAIEKLVKNNDPFAAIAVEKTIESDAIVDAVHSEVNGEEKKEDGENPEVTQGEATDEKKPDAETIEVEEK